MTQQQSQIFPNPSTDNFTTISLDLLVARNINIEICDIFGRKIKQIYDDFANVGNFNEKFAISDLAKGTYFFKIQIGNDYRIEKIIIN